MNSVHYFLKNVGLTDKEACVYLALLQLGPQAASVIAKKVKIPRSSTFFQLENLVQKGFVKKEIRVNLQYFCPVSPENLRYLLKRKQQQAESQLELLESLLPELNDLCSEFSTPSKVSYFQGVEGVCKMVDLTINNKDPIYFILSHQIHPKVDLYIRTNCQDGKMQTQVIGVDSENTRSHLAFIQNHCEWAGLLRTGEADFESSILIQSNCTHFLSGDSDDLTGVLIESSHLAKTMKSIFNLIKSSAADYFPSV